MYDAGRFSGFDNAHAYKDAMARAHLRSTYNFVLEFGMYDAQIAFDLGEEVGMLLGSLHTLERPVRWMYGMVPSSSYFSPVNLRI
jgi:hypothetical protein